MSPSMTPRPWVPMDPRPSVFGSPTISGNEPDGACMAYWLASSWMRVQGTPLSSDR